MKTHVCIKVYKKHEVQTSCAIMTIESHGDHEVTTRSEHEELDLRRLSCQKILATNGLLMLGPRSSVTVIAKEEILENRDRNKLTSDHEEEME